jgi:hypothetical protein
VALPGRGGETAPRPIERVAIEAKVRALAADSFLGRFTGSDGGDRAASWIARQLAAAEIEPAGTDGFLQWMPLAWRINSAGRTPRLIRSFGDLSQVPRESRDSAANVVGVIRGSDPLYRHQAVLLAAHYDHLGVRRHRLSNDSIYNGADDNASGVVAMLEIGKALAKGPPLRRTVVFLYTTGEEVGLLGAKWYVDHPSVPLDSTVAMLGLDMIGRPDSIAGGMGVAWLTGFERSTLGELLTSEGISIVPDPRPSLRFFERSDNIVFAQKGVPSHTLSSFSLHSDYHQPSDEAGCIDYDHMVEVVLSGVRAVRVLATGPAPQLRSNGGG